MFSAINYSALSSFGFSAQAELSLSPSLSDRANSTYLALQAIKERSNDTNKKITLVQTLIAAGFDINDPIDGNNGKRFLDVAIEQGDREFARHLVSEEKANPCSCNQANQEGWLMDELKAIHDQPINNVPGDDIEANRGYTPDIGILIQGNDVSNDVQTIGADTTTDSTVRSNNPVRVDVCLNSSYALVERAVSSAVIVGGIEAFAAAIEGYLGASILHSYYTSYDPIEAALLGAKGGAIIGGGLGALFATGILDKVIDIDFPVIAGSIYFSSFAAGLVGHIVTNDGNSETGMNPGQTAAASAVAAGALLSTSLVLAALSFLCCVGLCPAESRRQAPVHDASF